MPKGVPVATVAIGNAANAGLLAARILASSDEALLQKMLDYQVQFRVQSNLGSIRCLIYSTLCANPEHFVGSTSAVSKPGRTHHHVAIMAVAMQRALDLVVELQDLEQPFLV